MDEKNRILVIEDDEDVSMVEQIYLENSGFEVHIEASGDNVMRLLEKETFDLILLDLMLPGKDGYEICREVRKKYDMPILMVTARTDSIEKVRGLNIGADDYITKPFEPAELIARVRANLRQYSRNISRQSGKTGDEIVIGNIRIQPGSRMVFKDGEEIYFPNKEFELLLFLAENANIVFSKEQLIEKVWHYDYTGNSTTVMVHINRIREKIEEDSSNPVIIETVWGAGYRLNRKR
ncbi:MAG: response regulator transcription factor [Clostridiales bacterium]|nr:response regulator transcription factor [Clostridiales bacterium]